jgi:hypothetical protein
LFPRRLIFASVVGVCYALTALMVLNMLAICAPQGRQAFLREWQKAAVHRRLCTKKQEFSPQRFGIPHQAVVPIKPHELMS